MTTPVRLRASAARDLDEAVQHLAASAGAPTALRFVDAVERAVGQLSRHPRSGSLRFSYELDLPELRAWPIPRFPYIAFYVPREAEVDVWRLLHSKRDIRSLLLEG